MCYIGTEHVGSKCPKNVASQQGGSGKSLVSLIEIAKWKEIK
jgi:hypothetical protein